MFQGYLTALITPFRNGEVDEDAYRDFVAWQIDEGAAGLVPCGTTGESPTLSHEEHRRVTEICIDVAAGRVPVVAGTGSNSTEEAISLTRHAKDSGADGALLVMPYYNKPTQEGMYAHYKAINDAVDIPQIIYNIPGRSVVDMSVETMARLAELPNVVGVKDATADLGRPTRTRNAIGEEFCQLSGEDGTIHWLPRAGRRRLHLGDGERGAAPVRGLFRRVGPGRRGRGPGPALPADAAPRHAVRREQPHPGQVCRIAPRQVRAGGEAPADLAQRGQPRADRIGDAPGRRPQLSAAPGRRPLVGSRQ